MNIKSVIFLISIFLINERAFALDNEIYTLRGQRSSMDGSIISVAVFMKNDSKNNAGLEASLGVSKLFQNRYLIGTGFDANVGNLLPISGIYYKVQKIHYDAEFRAADAVYRAALQKIDETNTRLKKPQTPEEIVQRMQRDRFHADDYIQVVKVGPVVSNAESTTLVLALTQASLDTALTYLDQPDNWEVRVFFNAIHKNDSETLSAEVEWQSGKYGLNNQNLNKKIVNFPSTKLIVSAGDVLELPHVGKLKIDTVLPQTNERSAWLVMTPL